MRTPKKLLIFQNGRPSTQCVVVLQKRTTPTFESILRYISELMQFRVAKLHALDGRRIDGLPALIMCSGTVVAAGREKFKPANYTSQKSVPPTRKRSNRKGVRRLKALNHKKRSFALKPRILSPSSERYIVNQIHNSMAESSYSVPTNSREMVSSHLLESVAESEENFLGDGVEGQDCLLPTDDDIEKSFRVNQDGSMTVEMKVRLTIKEEETIHWTTTLSRSCVSNQLNEDCLPAPEPEQEISLSEADHMDLNPPTAPSKDISINKDIYNEDPTSLHNGPYIDGSFEEDFKKANGNLVSPLRTSSFGQTQFRAKQASVESVTSLTADGLQEDMIGSYFEEHIENGDITEHFCMVKHTNSRPVPKPRRVGSVEANSCNISAYKAAGMGILQVDSSGEEVTETVMHIYEQQTCQDNFLANICAQAMSTSVNFSRPATSDTTHHLFNDNFHSEPCRPSTASEPASLWKSESISLKSDLTLESQNISLTHEQPLPQKITKNQMKEKAKNIKKEKKASPKHKVTVKRLKSPGNKAKESVKKKGMPITSARFINQIYGNKSKSNKNMVKVKKRKNVTEAVTANGTHQGAKYKTRLSISEPRGIPAQKKQEQKSLNVTKSMPLPVMSDSGTYGYVEDWLEKAQSKNAFYLQVEKEGNSEKTNLENDPCLMSVAEKVKSLKEKSKTPNSSTALASEFTRNGSVRQKIKSFENQSEDRQHNSTNSAKSIVLTGNICSKDNLTDVPLDKSASIIVQFEESSNSLIMDLPPPPSESLLEFSSAHGMEASAESSPLYRLSSVSDIHPLSTSPTSDRAISPTDHTMEMASSIQADNSSELRDAPLQRAPSIKRAPLVSNLSLERKMSLKKASLDEYTIPKESAALPIHAVTDNSVRKSIDPSADRLQSKSIGDTKSSQSYLSSASPASLPTDHRTSSSNVLSCDTPQTMTHSSEQFVSPKPKGKTAKLVGSPSPERKHQTQRPSSDTLKKFPKLTSINNLPAEKKASPKNERKKSTTPSASPANEKRQTLSKAKRLQKTSPYSQSLDLASPTVKHKTSTKSLHRNLSTDSALLSPVKTPRKMTIQKKTENKHPLKQSNKTIPDELAQIQDTSDAAKGDNSTADQEVNMGKLQQLNTNVTQELVRSNSCEKQSMKKHTADENILDFSLKLNEDKDMTHNKIVTSDIVQLKPSVCEQKTEHLLSMSDSRVTETEMPNSQCYVELNVSKPKSRLSSDSESEPNTLSDADRGAMEEPCSVDDTGTDIDELSFSEENLLNDNKELKVIVEEPLSDEEQEAGTDLMLKKQLTENDTDLENDSGNDHSTCEECIETVLPSNDKTLIDVELCSNEDVIMSEEETAVMSQYIKEKCNQTVLSDDEKIQNIAKKLCGEVISQSVADRATCLEDKPTNGLKEVASLSQRKAFLKSDGEDSSSESSTSQLNLSTRSAPQSSLSFSYDSSSIITKQPEGNRVKSIREMFLAKSATDNLLTQKQNSADVTEIRAETSFSGGYQSQTSSELSSGEDDSSRKSISKGFVMRTIERLYGKKESPAQSDKHARPLSANKQKKKDQPSIFSPFHAVRSKTVSELSYFNSSNALDTLTDATRCIAFNAQVVPGDSVLIDNGQWLLHDTTVLRKSVSDPVAISQNLTCTTQEEREPCKDTEEKTPYLLFKTDSEDEQTPLSRKCTYFSLPHASDSEAVQEESAVKCDVKNDCCEPKDDSEGTKMTSEKNGKLPGIVTDFKIMDNKVHPLVEAPSDGETVVVQPVRGQAVVNRRLQEPDMLDLLYNFCGAHCPIL